MQVLTSNLTLEALKSQEAAFGRFLKKIKMKKFLLPFQNMVRADLFSGSLAVWNALGFLIHFARPFRAAQSAARSEFRSSYFKNTPPDGKMQICRGCLVPPLAGLG